MIPQSPADDAPKPRQCVGPDHSMRDGKWVCGEHPKAEPAPKPDYYYKGGSTTYTDNDPEVTCPSCHKTYRTDAMDATCRLCGKPHDLSRLAEFGFPPKAEPAPRWSDRIKFTAEDLCPSCSNGRSRCDCHAKPCEHRWINDGSGGKVCMVCSTPAPKEKPPRNLDCADGYVGCDRRGKHKHETSGPCEENNRG